MNTAALAQLRAKKQYEKQIDSLSNTKHSLEALSIALENTVMNVETFKVQSKAVSTLKTLTKSVDSDKVEDLADAMADAIEQSNEIAEAISRPGREAIDDVSQSQSFLSFNQLLTFSCFNAELFDVNRTSYWQSSMPCSKRSCSCKEELRRLSCKSQVPQ